MERKPKMSVIKNKIILIFNRSPWLKLSSLSQYKLLQVYKLLPSPNLLNELSISLPFLSGGTHPNLVVGHPTQIINNIIFQIKIFAR
jgi:hypothetical protein